MERSENKFEKAWKDLFEKAEKNPREEVWTKIDSSLANRQLNRYRRKILFYKLLAAASVVLAIGIGYYSFVAGPGDDDRIAVREIPEIRGDENPAGEQGDSEAALAGNEVNHVAPDENRKADAEKNSGKADQANGERSKNYGENVPGNNTGITHSGSENQPYQKPAVGKVIEADPGVNMEGAGQVKDNREPGDGMQTRTVVLQQANPDEIAVNPVKNRLGISINDPETGTGSPGKKTDPLESEWFDVYEQTVAHGEKGEPHKELWAGINFSSGIFDPNISYGDQSSDFMARVSQPDGTGYDLIEADPGSLNNFTKAVRPEESSFDSEISYAYGIHVGYQIGPKFVIRGGISYLNSNTSTEINSYINNPVSNRKIAYQALNSVSIESAGVNTVNLSNENIRMNYSYEFLSFPVSLGYYLIDKKFDWMVMAGLSSDIFLKNTYSDENGLFGSTEIRAGEDSPYNRSYLNGTLGTLFGLSFSGNYRVSLEPSYRLGLTEFTKESAAGISQPSSFYITLGMSYIFR